MGWCLCQEGLGLGLYGAAGVFGRTGGPVLFVGRSRVSTRSHAAFGGLWGSQWGLSHWGAEMAGAFTSPRAVRGLTNDGETLYDIHVAYLAIARPPRDSSSRWNRCHSLLCKGACIYGAGCVWRTDGILVCYGPPRMSPHVDAASGGLKS